VDLDDTDQQRRERMSLAIAEAERARGATGDNPWVGCVIVDAEGRVVARGYTRGPGEDHAEIVAMHEAREAGVDLATVTLYSTLEPCAFHGRTPACARAIVSAGVRRVVTGILDPNPRVDGAGLRILRDAGVEVLEDVCADAITTQLAPWLLHYHPHEPRRRARALLAASEGDVHAVIARISELYGLDESAAAALLDSAKGTNTP
jgi:diaminohydroxyphosphoribosylaminopyrimidine deaminase/5-amino-6-(5-phosphoribosylamino)uracil reductase